jgi:acyl carrier protein
MKNVRKIIREFVISNFLFGSANGLQDHTSFLNEGIIDSTGVLELVSFVENEFSIQMDDDELIPENLDSINNIADYLLRKTTFSTQC